MNAESERKFRTALTCLDLKAVKKLLPEIVNINFRFSDMSTPLEAVLIRRAAEPDRVSNQLKIITLLLKKGAYLQDSFKPFVARHSTYPVILHLFRYFDDSFVEDMLSDPILVENLKTNKDKRVQEIFTPLGRVGLRFAVHETD